jgi:hypothetical protein
MIYLALLCVFAYRYILLLCHAFRDAWCWPQQYMQSLRLSQNNIDDFDRILNRHGPAPHQPPLASQICLSNCLHSIMSGDIQYAY